MTIKKIEFSTTVDLDGYTHEQITFTKEVAPDDDIPQVIEELRLLAKSCVLTRLGTMYNQIHKLSNELEDLQKKLKTKTREWNDLAEFLRTQGIRPDAKNAPIFSNLLPSVIDPTILESEPEEDAQF